MTCSLNKKCENFESKENRNKKLWILLKKIYFNLFYAVLQLLFANKVWLTKLIEINSIFQLNTGLKTIKMKELIGNTGVSPPSNWMHEMLKNTKNPIIEFTFE
jgi:hypothetical protein